MVVKRALYILLTVFAAKVIMACCDCIEPVVKHYTNESVSLTILDNSGERPIETEASTIPGTAFGIKVSFSRQLAWSANSLHSPFTTSHAFTCDCPPELEILPKDSITDFRVFTVNNFDVEHPAGAEVTDYFRVYQFYSFTSISEFIKNGSSYGYGTSRWALYSNDELNSSLNLLLMKAPEPTGMHRFRVRIALSDGRVLEKETREINLM